MCGIAGLFDTRGRRPFPRQTIARMAATLVHRGPDGEGFHLEPGLAFGHRRLAIIDPAGGHQPMLSPDGRIAVMLNGEIYNFWELRRRLEAKGHVFRTTSDTEAVLEGFRAWGPDVVAALHGQFAIAIHDRETGRLLLARDRIGEKPLHYALLPDGTLVFGSEIKAVLAHGGVPPGRDPTALADFLTFGYVPDPKTIHAQIRKLPPGHVLHAACDGGAPRIARYWSFLEALRAQPPAAPATPEELRARLTAAVRLEMLADVPIGAFLSGGVDSSGVVALMAQATAEPVRSFAISFAESAYDEAGYAARVAERHGTAHRAFRLEPGGLDVLDRLPALFDEPFGDVSAIPTFRVCREAAGHVKVCLTGDGGDEALAGYRRYRFHLMGERWRRALPAGVRAPVFGLAARLYPKLDWAPRALRAKTSFAEWAEDEAGAYLRMISQMSPATRQEMLSPDLRAELGGYDPGAQVREIFAGTADLDPLQRAQAADILLYLPGDILTKVDRASMANGLEVRPPMLDPEFLVWSVALPPEQKIAGDQGKLLLKRALEPLLPHDILYRPKQGFAVPIADWLRGPLAGRLRALGSDAAAAELFDTGALARLAARHASGRSDQGKPLWLMMMAVMCAGAAARTPELAPA